MKFSSMQSLIAAVAVVGSLVANVGQAFVVQPPRSCSTVSLPANSRSSWTLLQAAEDENNSDVEQPPPSKKSGGGIFQGISDFFAEVDAFIDDATMRKLGQGAKFYGKRKSNFYGEKDKDKKASRDVNDPTEDYQGPTSSGFFRWVPDESGEWRPVTRMKQKNLERKIKSTEDGGEEEEEG